MKHVRALLAACLLLVLIGCGDNPAPTSTLVPSGTATTLTGPRPPGFVLETVGPENLTTTAVGEVPAYQHVIGIDQYSGIGGDPVLNDRYKTTYGVTFSTDDTPEQITEWYTSQMTTKGWQAGQGTTNIMQFSKADGSALVQILISKGKLHTVVHVGYGSGPVATGTPR